MNPQELLTALDALLQPIAYRDHTHNGLLVDAERPVSRVLTAVSLCDQSVSEAKRLGVQALLVHHAHGFWNNQPRLVVGAHGRRVKELLASGISLYGYHLPLDGNPVVGNNSCIALTLGAKRIGGFLREGASDVGLLARLPSPLPLEQFRQQVAECIATPQHEFLYGPSEIAVVGICSGGAPNVLDELSQLGAQAYVTGEAREQTQFQAQDLGMHYFACGHHATEVFGVRSLAAWIQKELGLQAKFFDVENSV